MLLPSPLSSLASVLHSVCQNAAANDSLLRKNEAATRAALVDPVVRALGWDTANVRMVEPEKTIGSELRVDYLLHDASNNPRVVIEAKCLGASLDKHGYVSKVLGYALGFKVQTVFITDGLHWHCYPNLHTGNTEPVVFELKPTELMHGALQLIQTLDAALFGYFSTAPALLFPASAGIATPLPGSTTPPKANGGQVTIKGKKEPDTSKSQPFVELRQLNIQQLAPGQKPTAFRLPDGSVRPIKAWKDVLLEACRFMLETTPDAPIPLPDKAGKKTSLFSYQKPPRGAAATSVSYKQQTLYIYTNYSAKDCIANARYILSKAALAGDMEAAVSF